jgi:hypothetical protein
MPCFASRRTYKAKTTFAGLATHAGAARRAKNAALGFNSLKGAVAGFGAVIAGSAIVGGLGAMIKKSVDLGDALGKLSTRTGVAQDALIGCAMRLRFLT